MADRVRALNRQKFRAEGRYILYWSQIYRRVEQNQALAHAVELANQHGLPLLVYEAVTCVYPHANDRLHTFLLEGVADTQRRLHKLGIGYCFYLRKTRQDPNDVLYRLAKQAAAVVTDDFPAFIVRDHNASVPPKLEIPYLAVDAGCIVPMASFEKQEWAAYTIRPKIQRVLEQHLHPVPAVRVKQAFDDPESRAMAARWHTEVTESAIPALVADCEIDHSVPPSTDIRGGAPTAHKVLHHFLEKNLRRYARERNEPSAHATSGLSPYLHFGHISALEIALAAREYAREHQLIAEEFLEELIVRRELAFNFARFSPKMTSAGVTIDALPDWVKKTMAAHANDVREHVYSREQFERGETHDALWNATQRELLTRGVIHGYYRMYWGKKIIEWSKSYADALAIMIQLHDKYALDGRDPNTYTNILWCFGLHDRPWFERPIFGQIRFMSLEGMRRKTHVDAYIQEFLKPESDQLSLI
jgi:deoxyribodipyrimidine photo-lyase